MGQQSNENVVLAPNPKLSTKDVNDIKQIVEMMGGEYSKPYVEKIYLANGKET
jgi:hypothetical protein